MVIWFCNSFTSHNFTHLFEMGTNSYWQDPTWLGFAIFASATNLNIMPTLNVSCDVNITSG